MRPIHKLALPALLACCGLAALGRESAETSRILLASGALEAPATEAAVTVGEPLLVKFPGPPTAAQRRALEDRTPVYAYLPHFAFLVRAPENAAAALAALGADWVAPYRAEHKVSRALAALSPDAAEPRQVALLLRLFPDADAEAVRRRIAELGAGRIVGQRRGGRFPRLRLLATVAEAVRLREALAPRREVFWLDTEPRRVLANDTSVWVGQEGLGGAQGTPIFDRGIYGEGQVLAVLDTGIDPSMCYFRDPTQGLPPINPCDGGTLVDPLQRKVLAVDFLAPQECAGGITDAEWDTHDHGTHVAGTAAGDDLAALLLHDPGDGMAPGARLVIQDGGFGTDDCADLPGLGCPVVDLEPIFQQAYDQGARLHTNSWGDQENSPVQTVYTAGSEDADSFMWQHRDFLLFFASGNSGPGSVSSPSTAKSVVSVGATQRGTSAGTMASFSSCGPTDDGRVKPDLTVPGQSIVSANNDGNAASANCNTRSMSGTSMASPGAAGLAALARQYFTGGWYPSGSAVPGDGFTPSAALVKAALINSAAGMGGAPQPIPGDCQGWGRVTLDRTLHFAGQSRRLWVLDDPEGFSSGGGAAPRDVLFTVDGTEPLEITLVWTDFPSTPAAAVHLVNDLDLEVSGPGGMLLGNVFAGGESAAGGTADRRNTVEQVLVSEPAPGGYTVRVSAWNVPAGPQPFALVVSGAITSLGPEVLIFRDGFESGDTSGWSGP